MSMITKRVLSLLLCFVMLVGMLPISALADDGGEGNQTGTASNVVTDQTQEGAGSQTDVKPASNEDLDENQGGSGDGQTNPEGGQTSPEGGQTNPEGGQTNPEGGQTNPEGGQTSPEGGQTSPEGGQTSPEGGQTSPEGGQTSPEGGQTSPEGGQTSPEGGQTNPEGGQTSPEGGQENPDVDQSNPVETPETPADGENQETPVEEIAEDDATFTINRNGKKPQAVVYAASDFQPSGDDFTSAQGVMTSIITQMKAAGYAEANGALICGDYSNVGDTWNDSSDPYEDEVDAVRFNDPGVQGIVDVLNKQWGLNPKLNKLSNLMTGTSNAGDNVVFIQGNHDPADTKGLDQFGTNDTAHYGVFAIHEDNFQWYQKGSGDGNTADAKQAAIDTAEDLRTYLQGKVDAKDNRPIFVMSHVPLHFGWRTSSSSTKNTYGDNVYAKYLFDVLNEYGKQLNIIFLFGHNHSSTYDDYLGGAAVYLPAGDKIWIPRLGETTNPTEYTLNFTYMNAGYLGYYGGKCDTKLSSTVFAIYEDAVVAARYGESGPANLKDAGVDDPSDRTPNTTVYTNDSEKATITLKTFAEELVSPVKASGVMTKNQTADVSFSGLYGKTYTVNSWTSSDSSIAEVAVKDATTATITAKSEGEVTITANVTEVDTTTRAAGDTKDLTMSLQVVATQVVTLLEAGTHTNYYQKTDKLVVGGTYMFIDIENEGSWIGQQQALEHTGNPDTGKEGDTQTNGAQEINAAGQQVIQLPVDGETLTLANPGNYGSRIWKVEAGSQTGRYKIKNNVSDRSKPYLWAGEGDGDFRDIDSDMDRINTESSVNGSGGNWAYNSSFGLYSNTKSEGFQYALYYSQAQKDFSTYRINHNGSKLSYTDFNDSGNPMDDEQVNSKVYPFEKKDLVLTKPIYAQINDTTGYVNKDAGYLSSDGSSRLGGAQTGDQIILTHDNTTLTIPVTIDMLSGIFDVTVPGTYSGLTVTYADKKISENYTLVVNDSVTLLKNDAAREYMDTIYTLTDTMIPGKQYLIVDSNEAGIAHAMGVTAGNVTAHNVRIHDLPVDDEQMLLIDSSRYSTTADPVGTDLISRGITDQGNINAYFTSATDREAEYLKAISLVWTPTQRMYATASGVYDVRYVDWYFWLSQHQVSAGAANRLLSISKNAKDNSLKLRSTEVEKGYETNDPNGASEDRWWVLWQYSPSKGVHLSPSNVRNNYLFYNWQNVDASGSTLNAANKNFQNGYHINTSSGRDYDLTGLRRTWIYERVTNIDTISARISDKFGTVEQYVDKKNEVPNAGTLLDDYILVDTLHADGETTTKQVRINLSMLSGNYDIATVGTYSGLTVTYQGIVICRDYTLEVVKFAPEGDQRNYPEFPKEGAVRINKQLDTTQYDYNRTGMANIDLSVTGIPARTPVDLVVILDASSSMSDCVHGVELGGTCQRTETVTNPCGYVNADKTRMAQMENTLQAMLTQLKTPINGKTPDIDVAVATFNGYTVMNSSYELWYTGVTNSNGTAINHETGQEANEDKPDASKVLRGFTAIADINPGSFNLTTGMDTQINRGTNYDRGMELAYELLSAKQAENSEKGIARDAVVVFMSDGAPYQFNYIQGDPNMPHWDDYFSGNATDALANAVSRQPGDVQAMYNQYNGRGKHWIAEAIKAPITSYNNKMIDPNANTQNQIVNVRGLGATLYTVGYGLADDLEVQKNACIAVLQNMATTPEHFILADNNNDLQSAFTRIAGDVLSAGDAVFKDQMGPKFNLVTSSKVKYLNSSEKITEVDTTATGSPVAEPTITVKQYELYKSSDVNGTTVTSGMVGTRKNTTPEMLETVTFNSNGTAAYRDQKSDNILEDKVIKAKYFFYNTDEVNAKTITLSDGTTIQLEPETFYWNIGQVPEEELVLSYTVYLEESMGGEREAGNYPTNNFAKLTYTNYLGNDCELSAPTPVLPWQSGSVGYAFYLVNADGEPIINQTENLTGSFENSVKITSPVNIEFMLNSNGVTIQSIKAEEVLPEGYELFDSAAEYTVTLLSDGRGTYGVTGNKAIPTTYVEGVAPTATKVTSASVSADSFATANTTVWFAVKATTNCVPDTVVIDYALPVAIDVLANDVMMGENATLQYVRATTSGEGSDLWESFKDKCDTNGADFVSASATGKYGEAAVVAGDHGHNKKILYTLNGMEMDKEDTFVYAVNYTGNVGGKGYYYSTVTVIPATSIYYEDSFVNYTQGNWSTAGNTVSGSVQAQDRPGEFSLSGIDANNIYGYDDAYKAMATYSMGTAQKATVSEGNSARAEFTFNGTGFDVISLTSNTTGSIVVSVKGNDTHNSNVKKNYIVDTYYGYKYEECYVLYEYDLANREKDPETGELIESGVWTKRIVPADQLGELQGISTEKPENPQEGSKYYAYEQTWVVDNSAANNALYQIPVIKVKDLPYGNYTATIRIAFSEVLDHQQNGSYEFYLDAIRIYDPANDGKDNKTIQNAYIADGEGWPEYFELRNQIISKKDFDAQKDGNQTDGIIFIDNTKGNNAETAYSIEDYKNFGPNNELYLAPGQAIAFDLNVEDTTLDQIHIAMKSVGNNAAKAKYFAAGTTDAPVKLVETATDLYYDITDLNGKTVVIENAGGSKDAILSITNVKVTYKEAHTDGIEKGLFQVTQQGAKEAVRTLMMMRRPAAPVEPEVPETTAPETTVPETTVPETTVPETTEPEPSEPEEEPSSFEPDRFEVSLSKDSVKVGSKVTVKVITSKDVEYITINGSKIAKYDSKTPKTKTWKVNVKAEEVGELDVAVVCYNKENQASEAVVNAITVKAPVFKPSKFTVSLSDTSVNVGKKVTVTVTTSKDVQYITVNGSKIAKCSSQSKNAKTWKVKLAAEEVGKMKVSVVCYNKQDWASKAVVKKVTVKAPVFKPDKFTVSLSEKSVKVGKKATVTVTTSKDVKYITINGKKVTDYTHSKNTRTWKLKVKGETVGKMDVSVVCYNEDQLASKAVVKTITVKKK